MRLLNLGGGGAMRVCGRGVFRLGGGGGGPEINNPANATTWVHESQPTGFEEGGVGLEVGVPG